MRPIFASIIAACLLAACAPAKKMPLTQPIYSQATPPPMDPRENPGSLFDAAQNRLLFEDDRARHVGDIVLVKVVENASGNNKADTKANKQTSNNLGVSSFFGNTAVKPLPLLPSMGLKGAVGSTPILETTSASDLNATGETKRGAEMIASVGARVVSLLPGGIMEVEGARQLRINEENQILVVKGLIRGRDIGPDNSVTSDRLANATIEYYGEGVLADKQRPGWLTRILDNVWPF